MNNITDCMLKMIYSNSHLFTCKNCPIAKYHCCEFNSQNVYLLIHFLDRDIQKLQVIKEKLVDRLK